MNLRSHLLGIIITVVTSGNLFAEEIRDYYAEPGLNPFKETLNQNFNEHIDPFSGGLQLTYTDLLVPGNGGFDIKVNRTYNNPQESNAPGTPNSTGIGWTIHFGRIVTSQSNMDKLCNQGSLWGVETTNNPSVELPDGGREMLVAADTTLFPDLGTNDLLTRSNIKATCGPGGNGLIVTTPAGTVYTMDQFEFVVTGDGTGEPSWFTSRIDDVHGNYLLITYTDHSTGGYKEISTITGFNNDDTPDGRFVEFRYQDLDGDGVNDVLSEIESNNQVWQYHYDVIPGNEFSNYYQLREVVRPDGLRWQYEYFSPTETAGKYAVRRVTYPYGGYINYTYGKVRFDPQQPIETTVVASKTTGGVDITPGTWTYSYSPAGYDAGGQLLDVTSVTTPNARHIYVHYGAQSHAPNWVVGSQALHQVLDVTGTTLIDHIVSQWGPRKISNENFWHGRDTGVIDNETNAPQLIQRGHYREGSNFNTIYSNYDVYGNPGTIEETTNITLQPQKITNITYFNNPAKWILGRPDNETLQGFGTIDRTYDSGTGDLLSEDKYGVLTQYTYTPAGDIKTITDARNNVTTFSNYHRGIAQLEQRPETITLSREVNNTGTVKSRTNGRGFTTSFTYDNLNRLTGIDYPLNADVSIAWNSHNKTLTRGDYQQVDVFDGFGQIIQTDRSDTNSATAQTITKTMQLDALGQTVFESYPNSSNGTNFQYDALGRVVRIDHPDATFKSFEYGNPVANFVNETDERGNTTVYFYRAYGTPGNGRALYRIQTPENTTLIDRNLLNQITQVFQGELQEDGTTIVGQGREFVYDSRNFLINEIHPETGTTVYGRDPVGNKISSQVGSSAVTNYIYDGLNRLTSIDYPDGTPDVSYEYNDNSNVVSLTKGNTRWVYAYDDNDNLTDETLTLTLSEGDQNFSFGYSYNGLDALTGITYPDGIIVDYAPDNLGRPTKIGDFASNVTYHPNGSVQSYELANGQTTTISLTPRLFPETINVNNGAATVVDLNYAYDGVGNVLSITDGVDPSNTVSLLDYDGINRLIQADGPWGAGTIAYNARDSITRKTIGTNDIQYAYSNEKLGFINDGHIRGYGYDEYGNVNGVTDDFGGVVSFSTFAYDDASNMISVQTFGADKHYIYDGNNQRTIETRNPGAIPKYTIHNKSGQLLHEVDEGQCRTSDYIRLGSLLIARRDFIDDADPDADGLNACQERQHGTDPNLFDTDGDGLGDGDEVNTHGTDPTLSDTDGDGLNDGDEINIHGTNPTLSDTDGDGLNDGDEINTHGTNPTQSDTDNDGLNDGDEVNTYGTNPTLTDTDGDGIPDGYEVTNSLDPLVNDASDDLDVDGLSNLEEFQSGTEPDEPDTDGDRIFDGIEVTNALNPLDPADGNNLPDTDGDGLPDLIEEYYALNPADANDAIADLDGDGFSNLQEFLTVHAPDNPGFIPLSGELAWSIATGGQVNASAMIGQDGTVYTGSDGDNLLAFTPDGKLKWSFPTGGNVGSPAIGTDGTVYVTSTDRNFYAVNPDGSLKWSVDIAGSSFAPRSSPVIGTDNTVYVQGDDFYAINPDGSIKWTFITTGVIRSQVIGRDGTLYVSTANDLFALDPDGNEIWTANFLAIVDSSIAIGADGTLYMGTSTSSDSVLNAINPADGSVEWTYSVGTGWSATSTPAIATDGTIYIGSGSGGQNLFAVNPDGTLKWSHATSGPVGSSPAIAADGTIVVGANGNGTTGAFLGINPDGSLKWTHSAGHLRVDSSPVIGPDGTVYIGDDNGRLYALVDNSGGLADTPWPMFQHDVAHTGNQAGSTLPPGTLIWNFTTGGSVDSSATIGPDGTMYVGSDDDHLYAINPDGTLKWSFATTGNVSASPAIGADGTIYITSDDTMLYALDADGNLLWSFDGSYEISSPAIGTDGIVYIFDKSRIRAINPDGSQKWERQINYTIHSALNSSPAIGADGTIYVGSDSTVTGGGSDTSNLYAINPSNGSIKWAFPVSGDVVSSPALAADGTIYIGTRGYFLYAVNPDGTEKWNFQAGFYIESSPAIAEDGTVYVGSWDKNLYALDPDDGTVIWTYTADNLIQSSPAVAADGTIYIGSLGNTFHALNPDGTVKWTADISIGYSSPFISNDGTVFIGSDDGNLYAFVDYTGGPANSSWPMFHHDAQRTGNVIYGDTDTAPVVSITSPADGSVFTEGNNIIFSVAASDLEDGDLSTAVQWSSDIDGDLGTGASINTASLSTGNHTITAVITDSAGNTANDAISITVAPPSNTPPTVVITGPADGSVFNEGDTINLAGIASDAEDGDLSASIEWRSDVDGVLGTGADIDVILSLGTHVITASVTDSNDAVDQVTINLSVIPTANTLPQVTIVSPVEGTIFNEGESINFIGTATDTEDGDLGNTIQWRSDIDGVLGTGSNISAALSAGGHVIWASVTDNDGATAETAIELLVVAAPNNSPTVTITSPADNTSFEEGESIAFTGTATDPEDGDLNGAIQWRSNVDGLLGSGASITAVLSLGTHVITASVADSEGETAVATINLTVVAAPNSAPVVEISSPMDGDVFEEGETIVFTATAVDAEDGDLSNQIQWVSDVDGVLGTGATISAVLSVGEHEITATVTDSQGSESTEMIDIEITSLVNTTPVVTITQPQDGSAFTEGDAILFAAVATDVEDGDLSTSIEWASDINGSLGTGAAVTTTLSVGTHTVTAMVTDSENATVSQAITVSVSPAGNTPPIITITQPADGYEFTEGNVVTLAATAIDAEDGDLGASIQWESDIDGFLGTGNSLAVSLSLGLHTLTATVVDSNSVMASQSVSVRINPEGVPATGVELTTDLPSPQEEGALVTLTAQATGGSGSYEYKFLFKGRSTRYRWQVLQDYSSDNTVVWDTRGDRGRNRLLVLARNAGSNDDPVHDSLKFRINAAGPATGVTLTPSEASPVERGTIVTLTGQADGGSGEYEYQFWVKGPSTRYRWKVLQYFSPDNTLDWNTEYYPGKNHLKVWARNKGSHDRWVSDEKTMIVTGKYYNPKNGDHNHGWNRNYWWHH